MTLAELETQKLELLEEKAELTQKLVSVNTDLKTILPIELKSPRFLNLKQERGELVADIADVDTELRKVNQELRQRSTGPNTGTTYPVSHIVSLVAAQIAAGSEQRTEELVDAAVIELDIIRKHLAEKYAS